MSFHTIYIEIPAICTPEQGRRMAIVCANRTGATVHYYNGEITEPICAAPGFSLGDIETNADKTSRAAGDALRNLVVCRRLHERAQKHYAKLAECSKVAWNNVRNHPVVEGSEQ